MKDKYDVLLCPPDLRGNERCYIEKCLEDSWISTNGPFVDQFEQQMSGLVNRKFAIATSSGTAALELCLSGCGIGSGDYVIVPDWTFSATANAVIHTGATPFFVDISAENWGLEPSDLVESLQRLQNENIRPKAIIVVQPPGLVAHMVAIRDICTKYDIIMIEDAAGALGTDQNGTLPRSLSDLAAFSFNGNKIITASSGGMVVTDNQKYAERIRMLSVNSHGPNYNYSIPGYNNRMSNICAGIGLAQMERFDQILSDKKRIAERYDQALKDLMLFQPAPRASSHVSNHWMYCALLASEEQALSLIRFMEGKRIQIRIFWRSLSSEPAFSSFPRSAVKNSRAISGRVVALPCGSGLMPAEQERVIEELEKWCTTIEGNAS